VGIVLAIAIETPTLRNLSIDNFKQPPLNRVGWRHGEIWPPVDEMTAPENGVLWKMRCGPISLRIQVFKWIAAMPVQARFRGVEGNQLSPQPILQTPRSR
jgi:hypothetical protein